jgi:PAS domain S-box-containing protein
MVDHIDWQVLDSVPDGLIIVDATGAIVFANFSAGRLFGYARDELIGLLVHELVPERFRARHQQHFRSFSASPSERPLGTKLEFYGLRKDGQELPVDISLRPIVQGRDKLVVATVRDVSERQRLLNTVRESAHFNLAILSSLRDHIAVLDRDGLIIAVNDAWAQFADRNGIRDSERIGPGIDYFDVCRRAAATGDETAAAALDGIRAVLDGVSTNFCIEYECESPTESRWFQMTVFPLACDEGGVVVSHTNITDRKLAEIERNKALEEVGQLKDHLNAENVYLREEIKSAHDFEEIVGQCEVLRRVLDRIEQVARTDSNVLIVGETGTGKELIARAIHEHSSRKDRPLVKVNCAALPSGLLESELFGHKKGTFTGAVSDRVGRFELADGGSIFLDEIGELAPELQGKLLHVLQEGKFERLGSATTRTVDVRVIAATNRDLQAAMAEGFFRDDLYYRLAVFPIKIPTLRERREDIPLLAWHFVTKHQARLGKTIREIPDEAMDALLAYDWPGNIRELENVIERAIILSPGPALTLADSMDMPTRRPDPANEAERLADRERAHILETLDQCGWRVKGRGNAADRLGLKENTLRYRMRKLGISRPES